MGGAWWQTDSSDYPFNGSWYRERPPLGPILQVGDEGRAIADVELGLGVEAHLLEAEKEKMRCCRDALGDFLGARCKVRAGQIAG